VWGQNGQPVFFTVKGVISRGYFILNGIVTFLFVLRIIQAPPCLLLVCTGFVPGGF